MVSIAQSRPDTARPDPRRYFEAVGDERSAIAEQEPVCLYLETTNRCNLLCETCPRTFEDLEPAADMSWQLFTSIVDQFPQIARVVLHGVGEPMMVKALPRMVRYLKEHGAYVLFNTNGTLLTERKGRELIAAGLDELRVSLDAAEPRAFLAVRGKDMFARIVRNVSAFTALQRAEGIERPMVSLWLTGLKETIDQLPDFVRLAQRIGVSEIHLQRLVFPPEGLGMARAQSALFEKLEGDEPKRLAEAAALATELGLRFNASGATEPGTSLKRTADHQPWSLCRRPWTLMYFTAHGRAIPCCIAPFSMRGYDGFTLGDATQESLRKIWNGPRYQEFRRELLSGTPPAACASCGVRWSL
jgi:MoaA/NifB/PqqE/SkfB family radical SAM enzyme